MRSIPRGKYSKEMMTKNLDYDDLPIERALGIQWNVQADNFGFSITMKNKPLTRRGILSTVSSLYDPLGSVAPVVLPTKRILQELCRDQSIGWDDNIPDEYVQRWQNWVLSLPQLENLTVDKCFKPTDFGHIARRVARFL
jgi:hypothetical protein